MLLVLALWFTSCFFAVYLPFYAVNTLAFTPNVYVHVCVCVKERERVNTPPAFAFCKVFLFVFFGGSRAIAYCVWSQTFDMLVRRCVDFKSIRRRSNHKVCPGILLSLTAYCSPITKLCLFRLPLKFSVRASFNRLSPVEAASYSSRASLGLLNQVLLALEATDKMTKVAKYLIKFWLKSKVFFGRLGKRIQRLWNVPTKHLVRV